MGGRAAAGGRPQAAGHTDHLAPYTRIMPDYHDLLEELHRATIEELIRRLRDPDSKASDVANAVSYLRAAKKPEEVGKATATDPAEEWLEVVGKGRTQRREEPSDEPQ